MMRASAHYNRDQIQGALAEVGVVAGDVLFSHVGLGWLGYPEEGRTVATACQVLYEAVWEVLGRSGTWLVPAYTYSFCNAEDFDPLLTPSTVGPFSQYFLTRPEVRRSEDPVFSVAGVGSLSESLLGDLPHDCFGADSVYGRLTRCSAKICNFGVGFRYATLVHYVEQQHGVPYRYPKLFAGNVVRNGQTQPQTWNYYVRVLGGDNSLPDLSRLEQRALDSGVVRVAGLGRSNVTCIGAQDFANLARKCLVEDIWSLVKGPPFDPAARCDDPRSLGDR